MKTDPASYNAYCKERYTKEKRRKKKNLTAEKLKKLVFYDSYTTFLHGCKYKQNSQYDS